MKAKSGRSASRDYSTKLTDLDFTSVGQTIMPPKISHRTPYQLTPEQTALSEERKAKKLKNTFTQPVLEHCAGKILERPWITVPGVDNRRELQRIKVLTWNVRC